MSTTEAEARPIRSLIPARLDRLNWSPLHTRMVAGLGNAWILDGLQITVASSVSGELTMSSLQAAGKSLEQITKPIIAVDERAMAGPATPAAAA